MKAIRLRTQGFDQSSMTEDGKIWKVFQDVPRKLEINDDQ